MNHICISLTALKTKSILAIDETHEKSLIHSSPTPTFFLFSVCHVSVHKKDCSLNKYFSTDFATSAWNASRQIYSKGILPSKNYLMQVFSISKQYAITL